jgi:hypothetical protein
MFSDHFRRMAGRPRALNCTYMDYRPAGGDCTKVQFANDSGIAMMRTAMKMFQSLMVSAGLYSDEKEFES